MTTIKSLKDMYVKLGGSLTDTYADIAGGRAVGTFTTIPEMIQACTKKASGGETLPDYTAADNGKFLGVVGGEAAWAEDRGLPDYTAADNGKFLGVVEGEAAWAEDRGLPDYTSADNGKFLGVVEGEAAWAEINGSLIVEMTPGETEGTFVSTTTYGEAWAAIQAGKTVVLYFNSIYTTVLGASQAEGIVSLMFFVNDMVVASGASSETISFTTN